MHISSDHRAWKKASISSSSPQALHLTSMFGLDVVNDDESAVIANLCTRTLSGRLTRIAFVNAHCLNVADRDPSYRAALGSADLLLPDGSGIALALRLRGERLRANLNGTDFIPALCAQLSHDQASVFLLGGQDGVAERAAAALRRAAPGLRIAGSYHGFFQPGEEEDQVISAINCSGASMLLVAMGVPLQDMWLARNAHRLHPPVLAGVGGLFDFLSGRIPRAPGLLRRTGFEWTYRFYQEPARMWRRYVVGNPSFVRRAMRDAGFRPVYAGVKRITDILVASTALVALAPLLAGVAVSIRLDSSGPALLRQTRIGENGEPFTLLKFRSMVTGAEAQRRALEQANAHGADGVTFKLRTDPRITRIGRVLRKYSIDELPQLVNVLNGTMTLVGPRPPLPLEVARYAATQRRRLQAKPGLTCLWQVQGRADLDFNRQVELDVEYLRRRSLMLDLRILLRTVPAVLSARGAY